MILRNLHLRNIGPFREAMLEFATLADKGDGMQPITIITGVNGAGKSIAIDAIRALLSAQKLERDIVADDNNFSVEIDVEYDGNGLKHLSSNSLENGHLKVSDWNGLNQYFYYGYQLSGHVYEWVIDYWSSKLPSDTFKINNMFNIEHEKVLKDVLLGTKSNIALTNFICQADYLRSSEMPEEKVLGEVLYHTVKSIINKCLDNGKFKYVRRTDCTPIVEQNSHLLSLDKLSSGNIFLIEHLLLLLCKMYSVCVLNKLNPEEICKIPGLLLIDEIENHLHPKWQKKIIGIITSTFPNLQIILTTHSPFVVSSVNNARIYTCVSQGDHSIIEDETDKYNHMPIEEILASDLFDVSSFNDEITDLIQRRKLLYKDGKKQEAEEIEKQLLEINPEYFTYLSTKVLTR